MDTEKSILKKVATAIYNGDFNAFEQTILPLLNFEDADENNAPTSANPDVSVLLKNFCDEKAGYTYNHLNLLEAPDPYFLCEWVDKTQDPSPCPDYDEWCWEGLYCSVRLSAQTLAHHDPMYDEHTALIETLYDKYGDACVKAQQNEWLKAFYDQILEELNEKNVLFYPHGYLADKDVSKFLHFLPRVKEGTFKGMLSRSEYKFLLQANLDYKDTLYRFKQSDLYRNAIMLGLADHALTVFDDTFYAQYNSNSTTTVDIASENNVIENLTLALQSFDDVTTTAITKSDLRWTYCGIAGPTLELDEIAQVEPKDHTIAEILPNANGERRLFDAYRISGTPAEFICLEELLNHLPYTNEQVLDCIKLCCDSTKLNTVDKILSQLACNLNDYVPYDEKYCDKDGAYEDIGFHFVEGTALEDTLKQYHADSCFDYISYGRKVAENNAYCVGEYGYIPHHAENAQRFHACQFSKTDVCTLGLYAAGLLGKYSSLASSNDKLSPIPARNLAPSLIQRLESCGIVLEDVPDYEQSITTKHEEKRPFDPSIFDRIVCAYKPPAERVNSSLADDLKAATEAANRQQQQAAPKAQSHNQTL